LKVRPDNRKANSKFISYSLGTKEVREYLKTNAVGTTMPNLNTSILFSVEIILPDLATQKEIASILSSLDDKIELNLQMNQTLEAMAQAIFKEWFVNFNFPGFDGQLVDGLPKGWKMGKLKDVINILSGFAFKSADFVEKGEYKLITIKNVQDGQFDTQTTDKLNALPEKMPGYCLLSQGDILLSLTGNVGRICIVTGEEFLLNQRVAKLQPVNEINRAFTYFLMRSSTMKERLISISRGTAQQNLSPIETGKLEFVVPDNSVLAHYSEVVTTLFEKTIENINEISALTQIRDSLLPKLMTGKIEIQA
jgi:type I restriction enzyme, S subunit